MDRFTAGVLLLVPVLASAACTGGFVDATGSGGTLQIATADLPDGTVGVAYQATIAATGGAGVHVWSTAGAVPPGLQLDTSATGSSTTLTGTPAAAGRYSFAVAVAAAGEAAARAFTVEIAASSFPPGIAVTDVTVRDTVRVAGVLKMGLNVGNHDRFEAAKILKNQLPNPGFEPGVMGTVWLAAPGSTSDRFVPRDWNTATGNQPPGFWDGAEFEIVHGPAAGTSGTVQSFTHNGGSYEFDLGSNGAVALNERDVMFTRQTFPGARGMHGSAGTADPVAPFSGVQSLRLAPGERFGFVQDTAWRDGDQSSHKLLVVEGQWRVRLAARAAVAGDRVRVRLHRDGGPPYNPTFVDRTFTLGGTWARYAEDRTVAAGTDHTPEPWPAGTYRPALIFAVEVPATNAGDVWIDEVELYRLDESTNPTRFADRFVERLTGYDPGVLRWWGGQLGDTLDNLTRAWPQRGTCGYKPSTSAPGTWNHGIHDFLELCAHVGAEPWIVMPPTASRPDLLGFVEYLAAASGTHATRRANQGQAAPWTSVFPTIHLEWGNELWGSGTPADPFSGASVAGGVRLGRLADRAFAILKSSPHWHAGAFDLVIGGQAGFSGRQQEIEANSDDHDSTALAPYFGTLDTFGSDAEIYGPLFARPFYDARNPAGRMYQSRQYLLNGGNGTSMSIYEVNYHTTQVVSGLPTALRNRFVAGASGALALPLTMLVNLVDLEARVQCAFSACKYSFRFDTSGGFPPRQDQFVLLWGMLRDLYHYDVRRPTWLGVELINRAIMGDAITAVHAGDDPGWTQAAINGVGAPTAVTFVQSFPFKDGDDYAIVLMNLGLDDAQGVRLHVPGTPQAAATIHAIEPSRIDDLNDTSEVVALTTASVTDFRSGYEMVLPPHSIRAVVWRD